MGYLIKKNTAITIPVVMFAPDHQTEITAVILGNLTVRALYSDGTTALLTPTSWTEVDSVNMKGLYRLGISAADLNKPVGPVVLYISSSAPASDITKREFWISVSLADDIAGSGGFSITDVYNFVNTMASQLTRALGMLHENSVLDLTSYDTNNNLTVARLRIYDSKVHALAAGATGLIATYNITATYIGVNLQTYTVVLGP